MLIPDGPLHQLPFDALWMDPSGGYLAERFTLTLAPSAAIWLELRTRPHTQAGLALALVVKNPRLASGAASQASLAGVPLDELSQADAEGQQAVNAFPPGSRFISGAAASKTALLSMDLAPFTLLHFATHSLVDPATPERSAIVLASANAADDGLLHIDEISRLGLQGKSIILASCGTSAGTIRRSEGLMSLSRPFLAAGPRRWWAACNVFETPRPPVSLKPSIRHWAGGGARRFSRRREARAHFGCPTGRLVRFRPARHREGRASGQDGYRDCCSGRARRRGRRPGGGGLRLRRGGRVPGRLAHPARSLSMPQSGPGHPTEGVPGPDGPPRRGFTRIGA